MSVRAKDDRWNDEQKAAIASVDRNTIVSASAGSGKTSVMIERVVRLIERGVPVKRIVMLTFSTAVAAELRERIAAELMAALREEGADKDMLRRQIDDIATADIGTVHSFCGNLIKEFFESAGVDPSYSILTDDEKESLLSRAIGDVFAEYGKRADGEIETLRLYFGGEKQFASAIRKVLTFACVQPDRDAWLDRASSDYDAAAKEIERTIERLRARAETLSKMAEEVELTIRATGYDAADQGRFSDMKTVCAALSACEDLEGVYALRVPFSAKATRACKTPTKRLSANADYMSIRDGGAKCLTEFNSLVDEVSTLTECSPEEWARRDGNACRYANKLCEAVRAVAAKYAEYKREDNKFDFDDLEYYAIKILDDPEAREEIRSRYDYVCIDEYQDTNYVQEHILNAIGRGDNTFMVGDPKQSIYRFRLTEIGIFVDKFDDYLAHPEKGAALTLNGNYRSDPRILEFVNNMFRRLMTKDKGGIDYERTSMLKANAKQCGEGEAVKILLFPRGSTRKGFTYEPEDGVYSVAEDCAVKKTSETRAEAVGIVEEIKATIGNVDIPVKTVGDMIATRKATFGDIAVLCEKRTERVYEIAETLARAGIPIDCTLLEKESESEAVERLLDMFAAIDNPRRDFKLVSAVLSPFGGFSHEEAAAVRSAFPKEKFWYEAAYRYRAEKEDALAGKLNGFFARLEHYRLFVCQNDVAALADKLIADFDYDKYVAVADGEDEAAMLSAFVDSLRGKSYAATLQGALAYFEENSHKSPAVQGAADSDCVRFLTIHKSKGLEFPIVFVVCSDSGYRGDYSDIKLDRDGGIALRSPDPASRIKSETLKFLALSRKDERENLEEKLRLLYVAYTRAKVRLVITGTKNLNFPEGKTNRRSALACIDEVCSLDPEFYNRYVTIGKASEGNEEEGADGVEKLFSPPDPVVLKKMKAYLTARYPHEDSVAVALKHTVTELNAADGEPSKEMFPSAPETMWFGGETAARGTAYHKALERIDYELCDAASIAEALDAMCSEGHLTYAERDEIDPEVILSCLSSELMGLARRSPHVREKQFMLCLPANELMDTTADDKVLVQGTIDLIVFDKTGGQTLLVDFKKSNSSAAALKARYARQLELYAYAIEHGMGLKVDKKLLYVLGRDEVIEM